MTLLEKVVRLVDLVASQVVRLVDLVASQVLILRPSVRTASLFALLKTQIIA